MPALCKNLRQVRLGVIEDMQPPLVGGLRPSLLRLKNSKLNQKLSAVNNGVNNSGKIDPLTAAKRHKALAFKIYTQ